jgi:GTP cyclohydrolase I
MIEDRFSWQPQLRNAFSNMISATGLNKVVAKRHLEGTPDRLVRMYTDIFWGVGMDAADALNTSFDKDGLDQMIIVKDVEFTSWCSHHFLPFSGQWHFAYIPDDKIVGLSKIPRMVEILAARPQVQEGLAEDIVGIFQRTVHPQGCAVVLEATHTCMQARGIRKSGVMRTTALRGIFGDKESPHVKAEFFTAIK